MRREDDFFPGILAAMYYLAYKGAESPGKLVPRVNSTLELDPSLGLGPSLLDWDGMLACIYVRAAELDLLRGEGSSLIWSWGELGVSGCIFHGRNETVFEGRIFGQRVAIKVMERGEVEKGVDVEEQMENEIEMYEYLEVCPPFPENLGFWI